MSENRENSQGNGVFAGLTRRQRRAIAHIVNSATLAEGCQKAGISPSTYTLWRRNCPAFVAALKAAEQEIFVQALGSVQQAMGDAVGTLRKLSTGAKRESVKLRASEAIVEINMKVKQALDIEERLAALEARFNQKPKPMGRLSS